MKLRLGLELRKGRVHTHTLYLNENENMNLNICEKIKEGQEIWGNFAFLCFNVICMIEDDEAVFCDRTLSARNSEELKYLYLLVIVA